MGGSAGDRAHNRDMLKKVSEACESNAAVLAALTTITGNLVTAQGGINTNLTNIHGEL